MGGQPGNRQDNRQRGNAAQLLEKYKNMARDSQLAGDRVQTEYYLQFADHYFRVLGESRSRFDDQRRNRDDDGDEDDGDEEMVEAGEEQGDGGDERSARPPRRERNERYPRRDREPRQAEGQDRGNDDNNDGGDERPSGRAMNGGGETIPFDVLPPAIGRDEPEAGDEAEPKRPRRRTRAARTDDDGEVAPAA